MSRSEYNLLLKKDDQFGDYDQLRKIVGDKYFRGDSNFDIHDLLDNTSINHLSNREIFDYRNVSGVETDCDEYVDGADD